VVAAVPGHQGTVTRAQALLDCSWCGLHNEEGRGERKRWRERERESVLEGARRKFIGGESRDGTRSPGACAARDGGGSTSVLRTPRASRQQSTARDRGTRTSLGRRGARSRRGSLTYRSVSPSLCLSFFLFRSLCLSFFLLPFHSQHSSPFANGAFVTLSHCVDACRAAVPACHAPRCRRHQDGVSRHAHQRTEMSGDARPGAARSTCQARRRRSRRHQVR